MSDYIETRGRPSKDSKIHFDVKAFDRALRRELEEATEDITREIKKEAIARLEKIAFKENEVKIAVGYKTRSTSDAERKQAVINSIVEEGVKWSTETIYRGVKNRLHSGGAKVTALDEGNYKDTHVGLYYEYGTGKYEKSDSPVDGMGDRNPYRLPGVGAPIVTRSMFVNQGYWYDAGGNLRKTDSRRGGNDDWHFRRYIGRDLQPYQWFRMAYKKALPYAKKRYKEAISRCNPGLFLNIPERIQLNKNRGR